jgi:hypothetical protein
MARLRPLAILDATIQGMIGQPSDGDLKRIGKDVLAGKTWADVFKGASAIEISADGVGPSLSLRLSNITLLSIFLLLACGFRKLAGHGVEWQAMAAEY